MISYVFEVENDLESGKEIKTEDGQNTIISPDELLVELLILKEKDFSGKLMEVFVRERKNIGTMTAKDISKWKDAGMPEEVILAAMESNGEKEE